jgi:hypothetical protein
VAEVIDLDILKPEGKLVKLNGHEIDLSFVPCGITFEVDEIVRELSSINKDKLDKNGNETKLAFDLCIKLCTVFCEHDFPEMTEEWFRRKVDGSQINIMANLIKDALNRSYQGIERYGKN